MDMPAPAADIYYYSSDSLSTVSNDLANANKKLAQLPIKTKTKAGVLLKRTLTYVALQQQTFRTALATTNEHEQPTLTSSLGLP